jgi:hypothetical protein
MPKIRWQEQHRLARPGAMNMTEDPAPSSPAGGSHLDVKLTSDTKPYQDYNYTHDDYSGAT